MIKKIEKFIEYLKKYPESLRVKIAISFVFIFMVFLISLWIKSTSYKFAVLDITKPQKIEKIEIKEVAKAVPQAFAKLINLFENIFTKKTVFKEEIRTQENKEFAPGTPEYKEKELPPQLPNY